MVCIASIENVINVVEGLRIAHIYTDYKYDKINLDNIYLKTKNEKLEFVTFMPFRAKMYKAYFIFRKYLKSQ